MPVKTESGKKGVRVIDTMKKVRETLLKKAVGFERTEVMKEYLVDGEGRETLVKRKVQKRYFPPDMQALRTYFEFGKSEPTEMTDEELAREKSRLLKELAQEEKCERERNVRRNEQGRYVRAGVREATKSDDGAERYGGEDIKSGEQDKTENDKRSMMKTKKARADGGSGGKENGGAK